MMKRLKFGLMGMLLIYIFLPIHVQAEQLSGWVWPTSVHKLRNDYPRYESSRKYHSGTDFAVPIGTPVYSSCDGTVESVISKTTSYGNHIKIKANVNNSIVYIRYCHLKRYIVKKGDVVKAGDLIGYSGKTGNATGPHLHYEVRKVGDKYVLNPRKYLPGTKYTFLSNGNSNNHKNNINTKINPIDIGTGFFGYLINVNAKKMVTNVNTNAQLEDENAFRNQMWYFDRQSNGSYVITSVADKNLCLDVHNFGGNGTNVEITNKNNSDAQKWYIVGSQEDCNLIPLCSKNCVLDAACGDTGRGTNIQIWEKNNTAAQKFKIWKIGNQPNKAVVTSDSRTYKENSNITFKWGETGFATSFWVDIWHDGKGIKSFGLYDTKYTFRNVKAGKYTIFVTSINSNGKKVSNGYNVYVVADLGAYFQGLIMRKDVLKPIKVVNGNNVELGERNGDYNEHWNFYRQADGSYIIKNLSNDKALDVDNWGGSGANVQVYAEGKSSQSNQQWYICPSFGGCIFIPKHGSGIVMDCSTGSSAKGTNIQVWADNETKAQIFTIYKKKRPLVNMHLLPSENNNRIFHWVG